MSQPRVLIPTPVQDSERRRFSMAHGYIQSVIAAGAVPLMIPVTLDTGILRELYQSCGGVLLTGGDDVDPVLFGEVPHEKTEGIDPVRDHVEMLMSQWAVADDKPLFAICRGIQVMNVALGGTLIQDVPSQHQDARFDIQHNGRYEAASRSTVLHQVCVEPHSQLANIVGAGDVGVNSFHHQAAKKAGDGLIVTARSKDGLIEALEMPDRKFYLGVQWHPEEMTTERQDMLQLFKQFVAATIE